jgi:hypothetical protein
MERGEVIMPTAENDPVALEVVVSPLFPQASTMAPAQINKTKKISFFIYKFLISLSIVTITFKYLFFYG